ncbi:uncharacterized protein LOC143884824 [Tasmannia lanceolata]|uniref:uncharacterized protein LOC143884824 n=1 Tax=Tasmannia lanceolata TaxID=3420 RepID=UPI0040640107
MGSTPEQIEVVMKSSLCPKDDTVEDDMVDNSALKQFFIPQLDANLTPFLGKEFGLEEDARNFYNVYGGKCGFSTRISSRRISKKDGKVLSRCFVCSKEGFRDKKHENRTDRIKRPRAITREGCKAMIKLSTTDIGKWVVTKFEEKHNHPLNSPSEIHRLRSQRTLSNTPLQPTDMSNSTDIDTASRYDDLLHLANKCVEEGVTSLHAYNVAKNALHKCLEEILYAKENNPSVREVHSSVDQSIQVGSNGERQAVVSTIQIIIDDPQNAKLEVLPSNCGGSKSSTKLTQRKKRKCNHCKVPDHDKRNCPELKGGGDTTQMVEGIQLPIDVHPISWLMETNGENIQS